MTFLTGAPELGSGDRVDIRIGPPVQPERIFAAHVRAIEFRDGRAKELVLYCVVDYEAPEWVMDGVRERAAADLARANRKRWWQR